MDGYRDLAAAVEVAATEVDGGGISGATWSALAAAVGPGPLAALVDEVRSSSS
ncbi:MAG: hypothetical protein HKN07_14015 [Acidimicrobiia bacterium]|nr:hypothetical protein [Acidimicrobiia bacterium]